MIANSFLESPTNASRRYRFASLRQCWMCSCICLTLLTAAAAQTASLQSSQSNQGSSFRFKRDDNAVPGTQAGHERIDAGDRLKWFLRSTVGPTSLVAGLFSAALGTAIDTPSEYGPHWEGFGKRYGMRLTGISTGNAIEVTLGAALGEDPRYFHAIHSPFGSRAKNIVDLTFRAYRADGVRHLAYARYTATFGNNFLSDTWRVHSEADWQHALIRTAEGFGGRALSNVFDEFAPEIWRKIRHKPEPSPPGTNP